MTDPSNVYPLATNAPDNTTTLTADPSQTETSFSSPEGIGPVFPVPLNTVSGRYRGTFGSFQMELRVDVDGARPTRLVSGDFYTVSGGVTTYFGSFKSGPVTTTGALVINGSLSTTWGTPYNVFRISIPRTTIFAPRAAATFTFYNAAGAAGATYVCAFESVYFHTVNLEMDYENGATLFGSYNTGTLPHSGAARNLDVVSSYAEAGIQMVRTAGTDAIPTFEAGFDAVWTNAELETAMHHHFSIVSDSPKWQTYLLTCRSRHELTTGGSTLFGIMYDYAGTFQRQGCAAFQTQINSYYGGAGSADANRHHLYVYVHELGHSFNLLHSWDKSRPDSRSWMNYDWKYDARNGAGSFWRDFAFQFDDQELVHIRHDYRNSVIMGGDNWATNAGFGTDEEAVDITKAMVENNSGLELSINAKPSFASGEPVVVELKLASLYTKSKVVNACLHPNFEFVKIAIKKPNGQVVMYDPLADHCIIPKMTALNASNPSIYESAYIGYGKDGFYFDQPGNYVIKAAYFSNEGGIISSDDLKIRVRVPVTTDDAEIAELYSGDEQGKLFYLLGSDGSHLQSGNDALNNVLAKYPDHPLSVYAALVQGVNAARDFKTVYADKSVSVRAAETDKSSALTAKVYQMSAGGEGVDNITLNYAVRKNAAALLKEGKTDDAEQSLGAMKSFFESQNLKQHILTHIDEQIGRVLSGDFK